MRSFRGFDRITSDPHVLARKPCVRGMRLSVQRVLEILAQKPSWEALRTDDIRQVLGFAAGCA